MIAFVAAYDPSEAIVVFADVVGADPRCLSRLDIRPPSDGLWMFECDVDNGRIMRGRWRRPTDVEAIAAASGENPCLTPCGAG